MSSIARRRPDSRRCAKLTLPQIFSDYTPTSGIKFLALVLALKSDHSSYGGGVRWPVLKLDEICDKLHRSKPTVKKMISELKEIGLINVTRLKNGCMYEVLFPVFDDDNFRGKPGAISPDAASLVSMDVITSDISDGAFHLLLMLECTKKNHRTVKNVPQGKLRTYFKSPRADLKKDDSDPYISVRQIKTWLQELENLGIIERVQNGYGQVNEYLIHKDELFINGVNLAPDEETVLWETGEKTEVEEFDGYSVVKEKFINEDGHPRQDWREEELGYPEEGSVVGGGYADHGSLAKHFERTVKEMSRSNGTQIKNDDILLPALSKVFKRWLSGGASADDIKSMIDVYPVFSSRDSGIPLWKDFLGKQALLAEKAKTKSEVSYEDDSDDDYVAPDYAEDDPFAPVNRLAYYQSKYTS